ncbi:hypothetical protein LOK49_LG07G00186 [Camellia lanceoleosa]|uniref:Uncharacterized protein n=1 Tax=Camellia lanceoleosa TaxID=1840588 RepID=A0ACC0H1Z4_9ERIC|nr:hypothetical protein LOK49_LG07G00186 [Camellia lanceoleosa]
MKKKMKDQRKRKPKRREESIVYSEETAQKSGKKNERKRIKNRRRKGERIEDELTSSIAPSKERINQQHLRLNLSIAPSKCSSDSLGSISGRR